MEKDLETELQEAIQALTSRKEPIVLDEVTAKEFEKVWESLDTLYTLKDKQPKKGDKGDMGPEGKQGPQGEHGADGRDGKDGKEGKPGLKGEKGDQGENGKDGLNGKDANDESILKRLSEKLPSSGGPIRDALELLQENDRLSISAIRGLEEILKRPATPAKAVAIVNRLLQKLKDVHISNLADGDVLTYNSTTRMFENAPASSGGAWGDITGTLSNQADLQSALDGKANTLGADDNYVTDAEKVKLANLSGTNTGDQDLSALALKATTVNGHALSGNVTVSASDVGLGNVDNTSDANKPVSSATTTALGLKVTANASITGATKTKITYDAKGLVTAGADATTADIADSSNKRYVSDANLTTIGNQSNTNTGDETAATIKTKLGITTLSGSNTGDQTSVSGNAGTVTTNANLTGPITSVGNATTITSDVALPGSPTTTTQTAGDSTTKLATTAFVANAILGQNFKEAAKYATTGALPSVVYANGSSGVGATLTGVALGAISTDGSAPSVNDRILVKNQASTLQNGIYIVTATGSGIAVFVLTRATDANQAVEYKTGDSLFITSGSTQASTTWAFTGIDSPTIGTDALTFVQVAGQGSFSGGNGITITGTSIAIDTATTVDKTTIQTLTNKTLTAPAISSPTGIVKGDVGLGNVDNTSDANKPVSSATQTALNAKQATLVSATNIKTVNGSTLLGSGDLTVTGTAPDMATSILAPTTDETIAAGLGVVIPRSYKIASGKKFTLGLASRVRVL